MEKGINVLSLFDGISCAQVALKNKKIKINKYFACEIDKDAINVTQKNHPDTIQLGNIKDFNKDKINNEKVNTVIAGSPCQGFSIAGKRKNFKDERSKLIFDAIKIIKDLNPEYFIIENVKMKKECMDHISELLGVEAIELNSSLVSAQRRKRVYWTNIPLNEISNKNLELKDIAHEFNDKDMDLLHYKYDFNHVAEIVKTEANLGKLEILQEDKQSIKIKLHNQIVTIGNNSEQKYIYGCLTPSRLKKRQMGRRFNDGEKFYTLTTQDRHGFLVNGYLRRATPVEFERLQNLPDNYTYGLSDNKRYKALGNSFTVGIIEEILTNAYSAKAGKNDENLAS